MSVCACSPVPRKILACKYGSSGSDRRLMECRRTSSVALLTILWTPSCECHINLVLFCGEIESPLLNDSDTRFGHHAGIADRLLDGFTPARTGLPDSRGCSANRGGPTTTLCAHWSTAPLVT